MMFKKIDKELKPLIKWLNQAGYKTVASCSGHGKYPMTVVVEWRENGIAEYVELFSGVIIPRTKKFYKKDKLGYYFIPETLENCISSWVENEFKHFKKTKIPRCRICKKDYVNDIDSITGKKSKYSWKPSCGHNKNLRLSIG